MPLYVPPGKQAEEEEENNSNTSKPSGGGGPMYNADGSYATQSAAASSHVQNGAADAVAGGSHLRNFLLNGDYFVASALASCFTKMQLTYMKLHGGESQESTAQSAKMMLVLVSILRLGSAPKVRKPIDPDSRSRIMICVRVLMDPVNMVCHFHFCTLFHKWPYI